MDRMRIKHDLTFSDMTSETPDVFIAMAGWLGLKARNVTAQAEGRGFQHQNIIPACKAGTHEGYWPVRPAPLAAPCHPALATKTASFRIFRLALEPEVLP